MLRVAASRRILSQGSRIANRAFASAGAPSVMDSIVHLNFVDPSGARREVPGYIGKMTVWRERNNNSLKCERVHEQRD